MLLRSESHRNDHMSQRRLLLISETENETNLDCTTCVLDSQPMSSALIRCRKTTRLKNLAALSLHHVLCEHFSSPLDSPEDFDTTIE